MRLLLIADHGDSANEIRGYFTERGHSVEQAYSGESGLERLNSGERFDALLLERTLPDMDGLALCRRVRLQFKCEIPLVMLDSRDVVEEKVAGFEAGADDYLVRPFSLLELQARLGARVRRASRCLNGPLRVGPLSYDPNTLVAEREGVPIKLNPSTRRLLVLLMQNSHRVVSRRELERELWGDAPPDGDVLRAHMYALRNAVDKPFASKLLHTHHGEGYRLAVLNQEVSADQY